MSVFGAHCNSINYIVINMNSVVNLIDKPFSHRSLKEKLELKVNYRVIALNQNFGDATFTSARKKQKSGLDPVPHPIKIDVPEDIQNKLQILHRLTITVSDTGHLQRIASSENFKKYHLIALIPQSEAVYQHACTSKLVDIISFDVQYVHLPFFLNRRLYNIAVNQDIYFEVPYAPCIESSKQRIAVIFIAHKYHASGKSKNIFVTSAAKKLFQLRSPYDVISLGRIMGLNEEQSKNAILHTCKNLLLRAEGRRLGKAVMTVSIGVVGHDGTNEEESDIEDNSRSPKRHCAETQMNHVTINKDSET